MCRIIYFFLLQCIILWDVSHATPLLSNNIRQAKDTEFPFVVSIGHKETSNPDENHFCTGALITKRHVITSAHCLKREKDKEEKLQDISVSVGSADLRGGQKYSLSAVLTFNEWASGRNIRVEHPDDNDIAILTLDKDVENITPATLSTTKKFKLTGTKATVAGWGVSNTGRISRFMDTGDVDVISIPKCIENIQKIHGKRKIVPTRFLCTTSKPYYTLLQDGDSGGPLFNAYHEIIGINDSTSPNDKKLTPDYMNLHISVDYYKDFIKDATSTIQNSS